MFIFHQSVPFTDTAQFPCLNTWVSVTTGGHYSISLNKVFFKLSQHVSREVICPPPNGNVKFVRKKLPNLIPKNAGMLCLITTVLLCRWSASVRCHYLKPSVTVLTNVHSFHCYKTALKGFTHSSI